MGTNCGVEPADTYLFSYEYAYLQRKLRLLPGTDSLPPQLAAVLQLQAPSTPVSAPKHLVPIADSHPQSVFGEKRPS